VADQKKSFQIYQFHVLLRGINPPVWRCLLMRSDSNIVDLHYTLQIAFHWSDFHLHKFLIHGKEYASAALVALGFRPIQGRPLSEIFIFATANGSFTNMTSGISGITRFGLKLSGQ